MTKGLALEVCVSVDQNRDGTYTASAAIVEPLPFAISLESRTARTKIGALARLQKALNETIGGEPTAASD